MPSYQIVTSYERTFREGSGPLGLPDFAELATVPPVHPGFVLRVVRSGRDLPLPGEAVGRRWWVVAWTPSDWQGQWLSPAVQFRVPMGCSQS